MAILTSQGDADAKHGSYSQNADMNVTPFIDVMLVLLIVFMVSAPPPTIDKAVEAPPPTDVPLPPDQEPVNNVVSVEYPNIIRIGDDEVTINDLGPRLVERLPNGCEDTAVIRSDQDVEYQYFMDVLTALRSTCFTKIGLVVEEIAPPGAQQAGG